MARQKRLDHGQTLGLRFNMYWQKVYMKKKKYIDGWREHHKCDAMEKTFTKKMADIMQDN